MNEERTCWICLGSDGQGGNASVEVQPGVVDTWTSPCRCRGSTRWVHQLCIQRWIDEKQNGCLLVPVRCPQCQARYTVRTPRTSLLWSLFECADLTVEAAAPIISVGFVLSTAYASLFAYGAFAVCQVMGREQGLRMLHGMRPFNLAIAVPMLPLILIVPRVVRPALHVHRYIEPAADGVHQFNVVEHDVLTVDLHVSLDSQATGRMTISRAIVGALFLPTISAAVGRWCFRNVFNDIWKRSLAGGAAYLAAKALLKRGFEADRTRRMTQRVVLDRRDPS